MAEKIVSPGVFTREKNQTFLISGISEIGAVVVGPFPKGRSFIPQQYKSQAELEEFTGTPAGQFYTPYTAQDYLRNSGVVTVVRLNGLDGYVQNNPVILSVEQSGSVQVVAVLHNSSQNGSPLLGFTGSNATTASVGTSYSDSADFLWTLGEGAAIQSASIDPSSQDYITNLFGQSPFGTSNAYIYKLFGDTLAGLKTDGGAVTMSISSGSASNTALNFTGSDAGWASTPWIQSQLISSTRFNLIRFHTLSDGNASNTEVKIAIENIKAAGTIQGSDFGVFNVIVRKYTDTDKKQEVLETFQNVTLDPTDANYISRVIGDRWTIMTSAGKLQNSGDWANNSKYIRVATATAGTFPKNAIPVANDSYQLPVAVANVPTVNFITSLGADDTNYGFSFTNADNTQYPSPIPSGSGTGSNSVFSLDTLVALDITGSSTTAVTARKFSVAFQGGFDGRAPNIPVNLGADITSANSQGFDFSNSTSMGSRGMTRIITALGNADLFDFNLIVTPGIIRRLHPSVITDVVDMVEDRSDAFYVFDAISSGDTIDQANTQAAAVDSSYAATYFPWLKIVDTNTNQLITVPPSVVMAGVFAENDRLSAEWFAPAGLNRGGIAAAVDVITTLTRADIDDLYEGKVNPIAWFPGQGISAWGQKTLQSAKSATDRINVRRLLIAVKKFIASTTRFLVFEQNTAETRSRFVNLVNPFLENIQQRQGLSAFFVKMDEENNTPDIIDRNILFGQLFLQPTRTAEFIIIDFNIQPTGASFGV